jgi:hypothetical protein
MAVPTPEGLGKVFISYRRDDSAYPAGWLYARLSGHLGSEQVFKDVDSINPGDDFVQVIEDAVGSCQVLLAVIGDSWLDITDETGHRRLDDADDFVRLEIEAALRRGVRVVPILVGRAPMPKNEQLPESLRPLTRRHAIQLSPNSFESDLDRLLPVIDMTLTAIRDDLTDAPADPLVQQEITHLRQLPFETMPVDGGPTHQHTAGTAEQSRMQVDAGEPIGATIAAPPPTSGKRRFAAVLIDVIPIVGVYGVAYRIALATAIQWDCSNDWTDPHGNRKSGCIYSLSTAGTVAIFVASLVMLAYMLWNWGYRQRQTGATIGKSVLKFKVGQPHGFSKKMIASVVALTLLALASLYVWCVHTLGAMSI